MVGQRAGQRVPGRLVDRRAEVDAGDLGAKRGMETGDPYVCHGASSTPLSGPDRGFRPARRRSSRVDPVATEERDDVVLALLSRIFQEIAYSGDDESLTSLPRGA